MVMGFSLPKPEEFCPEILKQSAMTAMINCLPIWAQHPYQEHWGSAGPPEIPVWALVRKHIIRVCINVPNCHSSLLRMLFLMKFRKILPQWVLPHPTPEFSHVAYLANRNDPKPIPSRGFRKPCMFPFAFSCFRHHPEKDKLGLVH